jgi:hypothetical protein
MGPDRDGYTAHSPMGDWLSWLERTVHIREVTGSNPVSPTIPSASGAGSGCHDA